MKYIFECIFRLKSELFQFQRVLLHRELRKISNCSISNWPAMKLKPSIHSTLVNVRSNIYKPLIINTSHSALTHKFDTAECQVNKIHTHSHTYHWIELSNSPAVITSANRLVFVRQIKKHFVYNETWFWIAHFTKSDFIIQIIQLEWMKRRICSLDT